MSPIQYLKEVCARQPAPGVTLAVGWRERGTTEEE
jgi:hypothetical protein